MGSYTADDMVWDKDFAVCEALDEEENLWVDFDLFHELQDFDAPPEALCGTHHHHDPLRVHHVHHGGEHHHHHHHRSSANRHCAVDEGMAERIRHASESRLLGEGAH